MAKVGTPPGGVDEVTYRRAAVSSTRIREAVATGHVEMAEFLLGRPYQIAGTGVHGAGKGREIGWPTINLEHQNELNPAHGVYISLVRGLDDDGRERAYSSVTAVGVRPTLQEASPPTIESHLLDFDGDLYGRTMTVEFLSRLRGEQMFPSAEALGNQIGRDVATAREYFSENAFRIVSGG